MAQCDYPRLGGISRDTHVATGEVVDAIDRAVKNLEKRLNDLIPVSEREPNTVNEIKAKQGSIANTLNQLITTH